MAQRLAEAERRSLLLRTGWPASRFASQNSDLVGTVLARSAFGIWKNFESQPRYHNAFAKATCERQAEDNAFSGVLQRRLALPAVLLRKPFAAIQIA